MCRLNMGEHKKGCASRDTTSNALMSCDGAGYDWSDQAEEGPTNFALMAYTSTSSNSEVSTDSNCSSSCLENVKILKEQNEQLLKDLRTSKLNAITYKTGLESIEARILVYKKNEFVYEEDIKPTVKKPVVETSEANANADKPKEVRKNNGALIIEDWVSDSEEEDVPQAKIQKKTVKRSFAKNVNTARPKAVVNDVRPKAILNAVKGNQVNAIKASSCWVWKPKTKVIDHVSKHNSASTILKRAIHSKIFKRKSDLVSKRIERICELENRKSVNGIGVNAGDSKLMLLGINLLLLGKVNAARHKLTVAGES
ncbi:hypothetical protein Tco_1071864 [Tanacetum coccineum]